MLFFVNYKDLQICDNLVACILKMYVRIIKLQ